MVTSVLLSKPELRHLLHLLDDDAETGHYYGNRDQYYARAATLAKKLEDAACDR